MKIAFDLTWGEIIATLVFSLSFITAAFYAIRFIVRLESRANRAHTATKELHSSFEDMRKSFDHMHNCQRLTLRAVSRLNVRQHKMQRKLDEHLVGEET